MISKYKSPGEEFDGKGYETYCGRSEEGEDVERDGGLFGGGSGGGGGGEEEEELEMKMVKIREEFARFDWRRSTAEYMLYKRMMPDYLASYVEALGSYRGLRQESIESLRQRLISLSVSPPRGSEADTLMPPNISGMVRNKANESQSFDLGSILSDRKDLFRVGKKRVTYVRSFPKEEAKKRLRLILVEGLFLYFLAKFCRNEEFPLSVSYYRHSEPIKTSLQLATGCKSIKAALFVYFGLYPEVFKVDPKISILRMRKGYFNKEFRSSLKKYIEHEPFNDYGFTNEDKDCSKSPKSDVTPLGIVNTRVEDESCNINFSHRPKESSALLISEASRPAEGSKTNFKADNSYWFHESFTDKQEFVGPTDLAKLIITNLTGRVRSVLPPHSAFIQFRYNDTDEEAYLNLNQVTLGGSRCNPSYPYEIYLKKDDLIIFDAIRQSDGLGTRYRVFRAQLDPLDHSRKEKKIMGLVKNVLGGEPNFIDDPERLVLNVIENAMPDFILSKTITDRFVLEPLFETLAESKETKRNFMISFEHHVRKLFVKMITDHNDKRVLSS